MTTLLLIGVASALAVSAIILKACAGRHKKAEKREKAEIVKQLLALSEREDMELGISRQPSGSQRPVAQRRAAAGRGAR